MDAVESAARWHRWAVSGTEGVISQLLSVLDANLSAGWKRLTGAHLRPFPGLVRQGSAWYAIDTTAAHVGVTLSLERPRESDLRGGWVQFAGPSSASPAPGLLVAWEQVMRFLDDGVVSAARAVGAAVWLPTPEEVFLSDLPLDFRDRLRTFSQAACKSLPLSREEAELWRGFVIATFRGQTIIDPRQLTHWLVADGWSREAAVELNLRFLDHCLLLSQYADEVSAA